MGKKKAKRTYARYIYRVLKEVHPKQTISVKAMAIVNSFVEDMFERIASEAARVMRYNKQKTLKARTLVPAIKQVLPGLLSGHALTEGWKAYGRYFNLERAKKT
jgi:histone H2B